MSGEKRKNPSAFGRLLQHYRLNGTAEYPEPISRSRLAEMLRGSVSASAIEKYETGQRRPPPSFIVQVAQTLALTKEQEAALVRAVGADMEAAYLDEYGEVAGSFRMTGEVPDSVKRELSAALIPTHNFQRRLGELGDPEFIALSATGEANARNRRAQAQATMLHVTLIVQVARYHIHLARYERTRHRYYLSPPNPAGGDIAAAFNFTSFATHAIIVENHFVVALALRAGMLDDSDKEGDSRIAEVRRFLQFNEQGTFATLLDPFQYDRNWQWLREYRNRWVHRDPVRIAELGMQFSNRRAYWKEEPTALELVIGVGDPPETSVDELLDKGVYCFNLLAKQIDTYISLLEARREKPTRIRP